MAIREEVYRPCVYTTGDILMKVGDLVMWNYPLNDPHAIGTIIEDNRKVYTVRWQYVVGYSQPNHINVIGGYSKRHLLLVSPRQLEIYV